MMRKTFTLEILGFPFISIQGEINSTTHTVVKNVQISKSSEDLNKNLICIEIGFRVEQTGVYGFWSEVTKRTEFLITSVFMKDTSSGPV